MAAAVCSAARYGAPAAESFYDRSIEIRHMISPELRAVRRRRASNGAGVVDGDRDSMQRAAVATSDDLVGSRFCFRDGCVVEDVDECGKHPIEALDVVENIADYLHR